jgi:hypothetical protein
MVNFFEKRRKEERFRSHIERYQSDVLSSGIFKLRKSVDKNANDLLDLETRDELLGLLDIGDQKSLDKAKKLRGQALLGVDPKFKARRGVQEYLKIKADRPGQSQLRSDPIGSALAGGMFGRGSVA